MDVKLYGQNQYGTGSATLMGIGGGALVGLGKQLEGDLSLRYYSGNIKSGPKTVGLTGLVLDAMFRYYL